MNPMNFDWLNQIITNETNEDENILQSLGLDPTASGEDGGQDIVKYLFDSTQFPTPLDSNAVPTVTSPLSNNSHSSNFVDGENPKLTSMTILNSNLTSIPTLDQSWLLTMDSQLPMAVTTSNISPPSNKSTTQSSTSTSSRKMRLKKARPPIFVTEKPQNAYKKRTRKPPTDPNTAPSNLPSTAEGDRLPQSQQQDSSSSPSSPFDDDDDMDNNDTVDKRHLSSKEKRLLRNKISARNFRVRRKEYINQLETLVDEQEDEINLLKKENKRLTSLNQQMVNELFQLKLQQPCTISPLPQQQQMQQPYQSAHPTMMISPSSSETNSPPDIMNTLLDFNLFSNNSTYLSHSLMPDFDLSRVLDDKLKTPPSPSSDLEDHRAFMSMYPLLAPALASMVIRHTFTLHYAAYLSNTFPYNTSSKKKNEPLDIMHLDDWVTAMSSATTTQPIGSAGGDDPNDNGEKHMITSHAVERIESSSSSSSLSICRGGDGGNTDDSWRKVHERNILLEHYPYYALMRLRGYSHDQVMRRCQASVQRRMATERQKGSMASCTKWQALRGFSAVATTLLRNPSRTPMVASVIQDTKACQISSHRNVKTKVPLIMAAPMRALRIGGGVKA